jgi:hypothetical protein
MLERSAEGLIMLPYPVGLGARWDLGFVKEGVEVKAVAEVRAVAENLAEALRLPQAGGASFLTLSVAFLGKGLSSKEGRELSALICLMPFELLRSVVEGCLSACSADLFLLLSDFLFVPGPSSSSQMSTAFARLSCQLSALTAGHPSTICHVNES